MKRLKILLGSGVSLLAMSSHAHADPVSLIATAIHGFLLSSTAIAATAAGTIATIAANAIVIGGALVGSALLGGAQGGAVKPSDAKNTFETGESSVIEGIGRARVGGLKAFGNTDGSTRGRLIARLQGPIDAIEAYYLGQREVTVEANGDVSSPPWARPNGSWCNWKDKLGTGTETTWTGLQSLFPTLWTSAHRVRGIAQSQLLFYNPGLGEKKYLSLYQSGVPETEWVCRASKIFDPRDLTQSPNDASTWKWSDNAPLAAAHMLRRDPAFNWMRFNWTKIAASAAKADILVATKTGTEKRSRAWGIWKWEAERGATMRQLLDSTGLELRLDDTGKIYFDLIDDEITPEISFDPRDIIEFAWQAGPEAVERPNICRVSYYSPERGYEMADLNLDGIAWARIGDEVTRYGPKYFDVELPFCPSASQAQRIARRLFAVARADRGTLQMNQVGMAAWGRLYAQVEEPDLGDIELVKMETPEIDDDNGTVDIPFTVWPSLTPWNPTTDEAAAPEVLPDLGYTSDLPTPSAPVQMISVTYPVSGNKEFRLRYSVSGSPSTVEANYRVITGGLPGVWQSMSEIGTTVAYDGLDLLGATVDGRVRAFEGDEGSNFSNIYSSVVGVSNTAPAAPSAISVTDSDTDFVGVFRSNSFNVAAVQLRRRVNTGIGPGDWVVVSTKDARPGQDVSFTSSVSVPPSRTVTWSVWALTSDGTTGPDLTYSYTAPAD